jgi:hypothetical protein
MREFAIGLTGVTALFAVRNLAMECPGYDAD